MSTAVEEPKVRPAAPSNQLRDVLAALQNEVATLRSKVADLEQRGPRQRQVGVGDGVTWWQYTVKEVLAKYGPIRWAALVTGVHADNRVDLLLMDPSGVPTATLNMDNKPGTPRGIAYSATGEMGCWSWPDDVPPYIAVPKAKPVQEVTPEPGFNPDAERA